MMVLFPTVMGPFGYINAAVNMFLDEMSTESIPLNKVAG